MSMGPTHQLMTRIIPILNAEHALNKTNLNNETILKNIRSLGDGVYRTKSGEEIKENKTINDLGVLTSKVFFRTHQ